jgi:hypothetical protein
VEDERRVRRFHAIDAIERPPGVQHVPRRFVDDARVIGNPIDTFDPISLDKDVRSQLGIGRPDVSVSWLFV